MSKELKMQKFAELAVRIGANMQPGQEVLIRADVACADFVRLLASKAYEFGAKLVHVEWRDEKLSRIHFDNASLETLLEVPQHVKDTYQYYVDKKCCLISISAGNPNIFKGADADKISKVGIDNRKALSHFYDSTMSNYLRWTIVSIPTPDWAQSIFPQLSVEQAQQQLWDNIAKIMRLNEEDPTQAWKDHIATLQRRANILNDHDFEYIHMTSSNGTDLMVGLADNHRWIAAQEEGQDGIPFTANMPTEEIFTAPHNKKINGVVHNALPLVHNGNIIDDFCLTFKDGVVVDYSAAKGYETLKALLTADSGSTSLGEIALLDKNSPIAQSGILFYNTMFDENASCHLALGKAYPTTIEGGNDMTDEQLASVGYNSSVIHVDFMVGTKDFHIEGITKDGKKVVLMDDGSWKI